MAQTQTNTSVQFHSISKANYDNLGQERETGALYFIKDNGEIRKGDKHITGARVYTATDPAGTSAVSSLTINLGNVVVVNSGTPDTTKELPKKGDTLLVEQYLSKKNEEYWELNGEEVDPPSDTTNPPAGYVKKTRKVLDPNGTKGYSAYIYNKPGDPYSSDGWQACCENVDASKVILTDDIMMAGDYKNVGNKDKGSTTASQNWAISGKSVAEALQEIFTKKLQPDVTQPYVTLKINNSDANYSVEKEVGETATIPSYAATLNPGSYTYGPPTGVTATGWSVTTTVQGDTARTSSSGSLPSLVAEDTNKSYTVTATATYGAGATPKDNIGGTAEVSGIAAGNKSASHTVTVKGYRKGFYLVHNNADMVDVATDTTKIESGYLRTNGHGAKAALPSSISADAGFQQVLIFLPSSAFGNKKMVAETMKGVTYIDTPKGAESRKVTVAGAGNDAGVEYSIWEIKLGTPAGVADEIQISWS